MKKYQVIDSSDARPCGRQRWEIWEVDEDGGWYFVESFEADEEEKAYTRAYELNQQEGNYTI